MKIHEQRTNKQTRFYLGLDLIFPLLLLFTFGSCSHSRNKLAGEGPSSSESANPRGKGGFDVGDGRSIDFRNEKEQNLLLTRERAGQNTFGLNLRVYSPKGGTLFVGTDACLSNVKLKLHARYVLEGGYFSIHTKIPNNSKSLEIWLVLPVDVVEIASVRITAIDRGEISQVSQGTMSFTNLTRRQNSRNLASRIEQDDAQRFRSSQEIKAAQSMVLSMFLESDAQFMHRNDRQEACLASHGIPEVD